MPIEVSAHLKKYKELCPEEVQGMTQVTLHLAHQICMAACMQSYD
jgi:hypothetical protein